MSQLTIYLPAPIERSVKAGARKARLSVSAYIAQLVNKNGGQQRASQWPEEFLAVLGSAPDFPAVDEADLLPLDEVELSFDALTTGKTKTVKEKKSPTRRLSKTRS